MTTSATVTQYYNNVLQRDPTASELSSAVAVIDSGALTSAQVLESIVQSTEGQTYAAQVIRFYQAAFGRVPDTTGINGWVDDVLSGAKTTTDLAVGFVLSPEWTARYGTSDVNTASLQALYQNVLGRTASGAEIDAWLATGQSMDQILIGFANSQEFQNNSNAAVNALLTTAGNTATADIATVYDGVSSLGATGDVNTFNLTVNQDNLTGTSGTDNFVGGAAQDGAGNLINTLQSVDVLDGLGGDDTLTATITGSNATPSLANIETVNARFATANTIDLASATGVTSVVVNNSSAAGTVDSLGSIANVAVNNQKFGANFDDSTATTLNLGFDTLGVAGTQVTVDLGLNVAAKATTVAIMANDANVDLSASNASKFTTASIASKGTNDIEFSDSDTTLEALTITGAGSTDLTDDAFTALKTLTGSAATGAIKADIQSANLVAVMTGSGADLIDMDTTVTANSTVSLGGGNDTLLTGAQLGNFASASGGDGTDIINITDGSTLTATTAGKIDGFETLDVSGGGTGGNAYDVSLESFATVQLDEALSGALAGALSITNAPAAFQFNVLSKAKTNANFALGQAQTIALKDATGTSDAVTIDVAINDGNNDAAADGNVTFTTSTTIAAVETITVNSTVATADTDVKANAYSTTFTDLVAADVKTLNLTGDSDIVFTALTNANNTLTKIDANTATGDITVNASAITTKAAYTGSAGVDTYSATDGGSIFGGGSNDAFTLVTAATSQQDTIVYTSQTDAFLKDADSSGKIDAGAAETLVNFLTTSAAAITVTADVSDIIDVSAFGFTGLGKGSLNKGALASDPTAGAFDASITDFFADAGGDRGIAYGTNGGNSFVFIDANKDGNFTVGDDSVIQLTGVTDLGNADFNFG